MKESIKYNELKKLIYKNNHIVIAMHDYLNNPLKSRLISIQSLILFYFDAYIEINNIKSFIINNKDYLWTKIQD